MTTPRVPPWRKRKPAGSGGAKLTPAQIARARARAEAAGRRYPNLVDNMAILREDKKR